MVTGGANTGRVGIIMNRERHQGSFDIVHVKDHGGHTFATRLGYIFIIGKGSKSYVSLPKGNGVRMSGRREGQASRRKGLKPHSVFCYIHSWAISVVPRLKYKC